MHVTVDRSIIGATSAPETFDVEQGAIVRFAEAIGDPHPDYRDGRAAPPTFPTTFRIARPGLEAIDPARFLHGEQEYRYDRPIRAGDRITCVSRLVDLYEREGRLGRMTFAVLEVEGRDETGRPVFTGRSTLIVR